MSERELDQKLAELDRLLNDPETRMDADRVWSLLAEISRPPTRPVALRQAATGPAPVRSVASLPVVPGPSTSRPRAA